MGAEEMGDFLVKRLGEATFAERDPISKILKSNSRRWRSCGCYNTTFENLARH